MPLLTLGRWQLDVDTEATRLAYKQISQAGVHRCKCDNCHRFFALGDRVFPPIFVSFAAAAGIDLAFPADVSHMDEPSFAIDGYHGWYHMIGTIQSGRVGWRATSPGGAEADFELIADAFRVGISPGTT